MCSALMILILSMIDGNQVVDVSPAASVVQATTRAKQLEDPRVQGQYFQAGIMNIEVHDIVKVKPFKCR